MAARGVMFAQIDRSQDAGAAAAVAVVCREGAGRQQADGSRSDVVMSGVVDSGRESGPGNNIDANDSTETLGREVCCDEQRGISHHAW